MITIKHIRFMLAVLAAGIFNHALAQTAPYTATAGDPVTMTVSADGTRPFTYQWQKDGVDLAGATASTYRIPTVKPSDSGTYTVKVSNSAGSTVATQVFTVAILPPSNGQIKPEKK